MTRYKLALCTLPMLLVTACNVTKDQANDSTTISLDQDRIENGADAALNEAADATAIAANKLENAVPIIENSAATIKERAGRVVDKAQGIDVDVKTDADKPAENKAHANH